MSGDRIILALDLGSTFGYALGTNGVITSSGEVSLSPKQESHPGLRWMRFQEWLYNHRHVKEVLYEEVQNFRSGAASMCYGALRAQVQVFCLANGIRLSALTPGEIKGDFTGNGNAKKEKMCEVAINLGWKHGVMGTRDFNNECDAIALLWCVYVRRGVQPRFA